MTTLIEQLGCLYGSGMLPAGGDRFTPAEHLHQPNVYGPLNAWGRPTASSEHIPAAETPIIETVLQDPPHEAAVQLTNSALFRAYAD